MKRKLKRTKARKSSEPLAKGSTQEAPVSECEAKDYVIRTLTRLRRRALRNAIHEVGQLILGVMIEGAYYHSKQVFDSEGKLHRDARSNALSAAIEVLNDDQTEEYCGYWIKPDTFHQFLEDNKLVGFKEATQCGLQQQSSPMTIRFDVEDQETPQVSWLFWW